MGAKYSDCYTQVPDPRNIPKVGRPFATGFTKEGKKWMRQFGKVEIPQSAFIAALKMGDQS